MLGDQKEYDRFIGNTQKRGKNLCLDTPDEKGKEGEK
jgi:hypothetical protein